MAQGDPDCVLGVAILTNGSRSVPSDNALRCLLAGRTQRPPVVRWAARELENPPRSDKLTWVVVKSNIVGENDYDLRTAIA